ncbi:MAG: phospho-sugar mutase [Bifidobacteriaceae bacterium]|jgi:phosphomannomutase|nr:phospho-sugar mutase [Bifidobacteriaceae bacterium]
MALNAKLEEKINKWISQDVSKEDTKELKDLLKKAKSGESQALETLTLSFAGPVQFGTAGLRGVMKPGESNLNKSTIIRAAAGLADFCNSRVHNAKIVIGYDARYHSKEFAHDSAAIFTEKGLDVYLMENALPTPVLAFACNYLDADAAVMVTASHNPKEYNGYKVYLGGRIIPGLGKGAQIVEPYDKEIAKLIAHQPGANKIKLAKKGWLKLDNKIVDRYIFSIRQLNTTLLFNEITPETKESIKIVTTGMHGVGGWVQIEALKKEGYYNVVQVEEQAKPDPRFPTVPFPNPEEKGTMNIALEYARREKADLVLANDPDADRLGVALWDPYIKDYRVLMGDETAQLFMEYFSRIAEPGQAFGSSLVSSRFMNTFAKAKGIPYMQTLTGHKWLSRVPNAIFVYEEAIGFNCNPKLIADKDGPTAGAVLANICAYFKQRGKTLFDILDMHAKTFGLYKQSQVSIRLDTPKKIKGLVEHIRHNMPDEIDSAKVDSFFDVEAHDFGTLSTNAIVICTKGDTRILVRPSGTEPKVKFYIEVIIPCDHHAPQDELAEVRKTARDKLARIEAVLKKYETLNIK